MLFKNNEKPIYSTGHCFKIGRCDECKRFTFLTFVWSGWDFYKKIYQIRNPTIKSGGNPPFYNCKECSIKLRQKYDSQKCKIVIQDVKQKLSLKDSTKKLNCVIQY